MIVRMRDFKTNECVSLPGGRQFEPTKENPMIGFCGASRNYSPPYKDGFALECRAIKKLRETMGFTNMIIMIPFCRPLDEADRALAGMAENGLVRGENGPQAASTACRLIRGDLARRTLGVGRVPGIWQSGLTTVIRPCSGQSRPLSPRPMSPGPRLSLWAGPRRRFALCPTSGRGWN